MILSLLRWIHMKSYTHLYIRIYEYMYRVIQTFTSQCSLKLLIHDRYI